MDVLSCQQKFSINTVGLDVKGNVTDIKIGI